ncbi:type IV pilus biogenesis/stability protein PilW [Vibrio sp. SCSIO 43140]|uniref:type IV pilus biogenesis/stability protein PilW n=1 Tax=Vibrio sp. SCSIO 43140 TaxID=2819100 RepID=UPI002075DE80|nr:type IV pilus biogenesis/stability protein PilW [Vibrio sp. SCSIO 43140]USD59652.1 type IV pilus biogenesis/stability protein PilW [Vibrio sp. SCSIO 43140]
MTPRTKDHRSANLRTQLTMVAISFLIGGCVTVTDSAETKVDPIAAAETRIELGLAYIQRGQFSRAKQDFEKALEFAPNYYRSQLSMAHYYEVVGEYKMAESRYRAALKVAPNNGNVYHNYGTYLCKQEQFERADRYFLKAISQPNYYQIAQSYENAGLCALKSNKKDKARYYFNKSVEHAPLLPKATLQLAALEIQNKEYHQARLRLMKFHKKYGYQTPSLRLLINLEQETGNEVMVEKYRHLLFDKTTEQAIKTIKL